MILQQKTFGWGRHTAMSLSWPGTPALTGIGSPGPPLMVVKSGRIQPHEFTPNPDESDRGAVIESAGKCPSPESTRTQRHWPCGRARWPMAWFGHGHTVHTRISRRSRNGVPDRVFEPRQREQRLRLQIKAFGLDSPPIKVHPDGIGVRKKRSSLHRKVPRRREHQTSLDCRGSSPATLMTPHLGESA